MKPLLPVIGSLLVRSPEMIETDAHGIVRDCQVSRF